MAESGQPEGAGLTSIAPDAVPPLEEQAPPADPPGVSPPLPPESDTNGESVPTPPIADAEEVEEEEDPLIVAQREREEAELALEEAADIHDTDDPALKVNAGLMQGVREDGFQVWRHRHVLMAAAQQSGASRVSHPLSPHVP